jgi:hypothetical protein
MTGLSAMASQRSFRSQFAQGQSGPSSDADRAARLTLLKVRWFFTGRWFGLGMTLQCRGLVNS